MNNSTKHLLVALALLVAAVGWWRFGRAPGAGSSGSGVEAESLADLSLSFAGDAGLDSASTSSGNTETTTAPPREVPFHGFCPSDGPDVDRPRLAAVLNDRIAELNDRIAALNREQVGSSALRRGLGALAPRNERPAEALALLRTAPDRDDDGFDYAVAVSLALGVRALHDERFDEAETWAQRAAADGPADAAPLVLAAIVAQRQQRPADMIEALDRAFERDPEEAAVALRLGRELVDTPRLADALEALDAYLDALPEDSHIAGLRARTAIREELIRDFRRLDRLGVTLFVAPSLEANLGERVLTTVLDALRRSAALLGAPRRPQLVVTVYRARADMLAVICAQGWARAAYDGTLHLDGEGIRDLSRLRQHIEHESLHAQLAAVAPRAPLWLHEGLAQHFAGQSGPAHQETYRFMVENETWVPFASLNGSFQVIDDSRDAGRAYHQSLAMVELILHRGGPRAIHRAVAYLHDGGDPQTLLDHLGGDHPITGRELIEFLRGH